MQYCSHCGIRLKENAAFCSYCGQSVRTENEKGYQYHYEVKSVNKERKGNSLINHLPIYCTMAYLPAFFWLPLLFDGRSKLSRTCVNQGVWITLLSTLISGIAIVGASAAFYYGMINIEGIEWFFNHFNVYNLWQYIPYFLVVMFISFIIFFIPFCSFLGFLKGFYSSEPLMVPFFGKIKLIKDRTEEVSEY
ncbi:MAG: zinc ribbon domain-containing protein [Lachnotalea sp.]